MSQLPPEITSAFASMERPQAAALADRIRGITSPAHLYVVTAHMLRGDTASAQIAAALSSDGFRQFDQSIRLFFALGVLTHDARPQAERTPEQT